MDKQFLSIERLVEFGLELGIAQQMVNSMNLTMQNMHIPGSISTMPQNQKMWYVCINGRPIGPLSETELTKMLLNKELDKESLVWSYGMSCWEPIKNVPDVLKIIITLPPEL